EGSLNHRAFPRPCQICEHNCREGRGAAAVVLAETSPGPARVLPSRETVGISQPLSPPQRPPDWPCVPFRPSGGFVERIASKGTHGRTVPPADSGMAWSGPSALHGWEGG